MTLSAGAFQLQYENGFLRYIKHGDHEILRMIYFALRDENWITYQPHFRNEKQTIGAGQFEIEYDCFHQKDGQDAFMWHAKIEGTHEGIITFELHGHALQNIKRNRAGFCMLHPIKGVAGQPAEIYHPDNTVEKKLFPAFVSPENPFKNIQKLRWLANDNWFELAVDGDIFETEDQRNWTDASYKTFCTPQSLPFPVTLKAGDQVWQKVVFKSVSPLPKIASHNPTLIQLSASSGKTKLPSVGIAASTEVNTLNNKTIGLLRALNLEHYRVDVWPGKESWVSDLSHDYEQAFELGLSLEVALHLSQNFVEELEAFIQLCQQNRVRIKKVLLLSENKPSTDQALIDHAISIKTQLPNVLWGAGTDYNFTELNRNRFDSRTLDLVSYAVHPQAHASDDTTLIENLEGQSETAGSAQHIYPHTAVHVSPVTLKKRYNASATDPSKKIMTNDQKRDPRQSSQFAALWTFGSLRALADGGAHSVTYYQTAGGQGIMTDQGEPFPAYTFLERILSFRNRQMIILKNSHPLLVDAMLFDGENTAILWMANYSQSAQKIMFEDREFLLAAGEIRSERLNRSKQF